MPDHPPEAGSGYVQRHRSRLGQRGLDIAGRGDDALERKPLCERVGAERGPSPLGQRGLEGDQPELVHAREQGEELLFGHDLAGRREPRIAVDGRGGPRPCRELARMDLAHERAVRRIRERLLEGPQRAEEALLEFWLAGKHARGLRAVAREARSVREDRAGGGDVGRDDPWRTHPKRDRDEVAQQRGGNSGSL